MAELEDMVKNLSLQQRKVFKQLLETVTGNGSQAGVAELEKPADGIEDWLNKLKVEGYTPRTIRTYEYVVRKYLAQEPKPTVFMLRSYFARRIDVDKVGESAIRNEQKALKSLFTFLYEENLYPDNPMVKIKLMKETKKERECPTDGQIQVLLYGDYKLHSKLSTMKFKTLIALLCDTGLRVTEAASSLTANIQLTNPMTIKIMGKGKKERTVPIGIYTAACIVKLMELNKDMGSPYLFPGIDPNKYWDVSSIQENLKRVCVKMDVKPITPHQLRHWWATRSLQDGAKLEIVSKVLGHSSVGITGDVYRHIEAEEMQSEHEKHSPMNGLMLGKK